MSEFYQPPLFDDGQAKTRLVLISLLAVFDTEEDRRSLCVTLPIHPRFLRSDQSETTCIEREKTDTETTKTGIETGIEVNLTDTEKRINGVIQKHPAITISDISKSVSI